MKTKTKQNWEREFEKLKADNGDLFVDHMVGFEKAKSFIRTLLQEEREECEKEYLKRCKEVKIKTAEESFKMGRRIEKEKLLERIKLELENEFEHGEYPQRQVENVIEKLKEESK